MKTTQPQTIFLKDYQKPDFNISRVDLVFTLHDTQTRVQSTLQINSNDPSKNTPPLLLNGENLKLVSLKINGRELEKKEYRQEEKFLHIEKVPQQFILETEVEINPLANKALEGLYKSGEIFCTQNEPEGFRKITYFIDRPDIMAKYTTKIIAPKEHYPVLLSNGNEMARGEFQDGRHWVCWEDPFPKPCYLYALVAGDLGLLQDEYTTQSGQKIDCRIYCDKGNEAQCAHAMESLKKSMAWDEEVFGLEYDLQTYMIVAVDSFNMGAMENKGLNIFNSRYVLADQTTATDQDFLAIESIIAHEYFHNWTGNRVTCRDWFQLTLKEGLTVFRDQEFSRDLNSAVVQRIQDVSRLKSHQFSEDAGPTAHSIKPDRYMEINNFYTATVYEKGAEVIRMVHTLLGKEGFRKGMNLYFKLFDGKAVTTEDFLKAMSEANGHYDFSQFQLWYEQAGTPKIHVESSYDKTQQTLKVDVEQSCPPTPDKKSKKPFHFPLRLGFLYKAGEEAQVHLRESSSAQPHVHKGFVHIKKERESFVFENLSEEPILSVNRDFCAPIKVEITRPTAHLALLLAHDRDGFNRYEAAQSLAKKSIREGVKQLQEGAKLQQLSWDLEYLKAYGQLLGDQNLDPALKAALMDIPAESLLHQEFNPIDFESIHKVRQALMTTLAQTHWDLFNKIYLDNDSGKAYHLDPLSMGKRSLRGTCLNFLVQTTHPTALNLALKHFTEALHMTDEMAALKALQQVDCLEREEVSKNFFEKWKHKALVIQKWLFAESASPVGAVFERIKELEQSEIYDQSVPNFVRSVWQAFAHNYIHFHHPSGRGYQLMAHKIIEMDKINPQVASALSASFKLFKKLEPRRREKMAAELERIKKTPNLSQNVYEIVSKTLTSK